MTRRNAGLAGLVTTVLVVGVITRFAPATAAHPAGHFANADDDKLVIRGKLTYAQNCASCHGRFLQGQPLWQLMDEFAGRRAPAHDQTGHTWQHSDEDLFRMTKYGGTGTPTERSHMPGFDRRLSDDEILAVLAFIKRSWPIGLRVSQASLNPDGAGTPVHAADLDWRLPPTNCRGSLAGRTTPKL